jgi:hypothetical protein
MRWSYSGDCNASRSEHPHLPLLARCAARKARKITADRVLIRLGIMELGWIWTGNLRPLCTSV